MNKGLIPLCGLLTLFLIGSEPSSDGLRLDLEHHVIGWNGASHAFQPAAYGDLSFSVEAPPVRGLYPGSVKPLVLQVSNVGRFDLRVTGLSGAVVRTSKPGCAPTSANLVIRRWQSPRSATVRAHSRGAMGSLPIYMPNTVANGCQNATFTIKLTATGTQVRR
ncbi:hypothetical protein AB0K00_01990 [Dactylosporangium sp. NPDC049525]|uniref:hypothetical protein n=1 Tax=Dactylosporangium sp. NPDC049525 TaxID=3154730 RepID=UPI003423395D